MPEPFSWRSGTRVDTGADRAGAIGHFMQADSSTNQYLNLVLKTVLVAIHQYFLHARMLGSWGLEGLELHEYQAAIRSMKHADTVMSRILTLQGAPAALSLRDLSNLLVGENVSDLLENDLTMETLYRDAMVATMAHCKEQQDLDTLQNLEALYVENEHRIKWLRDQLGLIDEIGTQGYLESASFATDTAGAPSAEAARQNDGLDSRMHTAETIAGGARQAIHGSSDLQGNASERPIRSASRPDRVEGNSVSDTDGPSIRFGPGSGSANRGSSADTVELNAEPESQMAGAEATSGLPGVAVPRKESVASKEARVDQDESGFLLDSFFVGE